MKRQALHAAHLSFSHPLTGEPLAFSSSPPADMAQLCNALRRLTNR
jgi:23S rRNA pseudouridine1911/1915/1917 synthase